MNTRDLNNCTVLAFGHVKRSRSKKSSCQMHNLLGFAILRHTMMTEDSCCQCVQLILHSVFILLSESGQRLEKLSIVICRKSTMQQSVTFNRYYAKSIYWYTYRPTEWWKRWHCCFDPKELTTVSLTLQTTKPTTLGGPTRYIYSTVQASDLWAPCRQVWQTGWTTHDVSQSCRSNHTR